MGRSGTEALAAEPVGRKCPANSANTSYRWALVTMSEAKHTPGPWWVTDLNHRPWSDALAIGYGPDRTGAGADSGVIAYTTWGFEGEADGGLPSWANARLIASAPDLLAELKSSRCPGGGWNGMPAGTDPTVENCMKAGACGCSAGATIAKATAPAGQPQP